MQRSDALPDIHVDTWDETGGAGAPAVLIHGSTAWGADPVLGFAAQRPLATLHRLLVVDRRGYGRSPDIDRSDYEVDALDVIGILGGGAHLVGHSYGAVVAMLAAAWRPDLVRSLVLIEPSCYRFAADDPVVAAAIAANREGRARLPADLPPDVYLRIATESVDWPPLEATPERLRAAGAAMHERPCWEADVPVEPLAQASWPKLVINGTWDTAPALYRERGGRPLIACGRTTAARIGARLENISGASHYPHVEQPDATNRALNEIWAAADLAAD